MELRRPTTTLKTNKNSIHSHIEEIYIITREVDENILQGIINVLPRCPIQVIFEKKIGKRKTSRVNYLRVQGIGLNMIILCSQKKASGLFMSRNITENMKQTGIIIEIFHKKVLKELRRIIEKIIKYNKEGKKLEPMIRGSKFIKLSLGDNSTRDLLCEHRGLFSDTKIDIISLGVDPIIFSKKNHKFYLWDVDLGTPRRIKLLIHEDYQIKVSRNIDCKVIRRPLEGIPFRAILGNNLGIVCSTNLSIHDFDALSMSFLIPRRYIRILAKRYNELWEDAKKPNNFRKKSIHKRTTINKSSMVLPKSTIEGLTRIHLASQSIRSRSWNKNLINDINNKLKTFGLDARKVKLNLGGFSINLADAGVYNPNVSFNTQWFININSQCIERIYWYFSILDKIQGNKQVWVKIVEGDQPIIDLSRHQRRIASKLRAILRIQITLKKGKQILLIDWRVHFKFIKVSVKGLGQRQPFSLKITWSLWQQIRAYMHNLRIYIYASSQQNIQSRQGKLMQNCMIMNLPCGTYNIRIEIIDNQNNVLYIASRKRTIKPDPQLIVFEWSVWNLRGPIASCNNTQCAMRNICGYPRASDNVVEIRNHNFYLKHSIIQKIIRKFSSGRPINWTRLKLEILSKEAWLGYFPKLGIIVFLLHPK